MSETPPDPPESEALGAEAAADAQAASPTEADRAPPSVSAMDRIQDPAPADDEADFSWRWLAGVVLVIAGIMGVWLWTHRDTGPDDDLLREAVAAYRTFSPAELTNDPDEAAEWVFDNLQGWLIFPPEIEGFVMLGVGSAQLADAVFVPAFRYDGADNTTFVVFAYDYILLDEAAESGRLRLAPEVYARLAEPEPVDIRREGDAYVVTWRRRSVLFTAVAPGEELAEQISQAVRRQEL
ncbi:MAG: hypothetical protein AAF791_03325 [Bacteroidota bacterium]